SGILRSGLARTPHRASEPDAGFCEQGACPCERNPAIRLARTPHRASEPDAGFCEQGALIVSRAPHRASHLERARESPGCSVERLEDAVRSGWGPAADGLLELFHISPPDLCPALRAFGATSSGLRRRGQRIWRRYVEQLRPSLGITSASGC